MGIALCLGAQRAWTAYRDSGCDVSMKTELAPDGHFRASLTNKTCSWGFGLAANFSSVRLEELGTAGWFENIDLETDQPVSESPTMKWSGPNDLEVGIKSDHITGAIQSTENGLRFIRTYVSAK